MANIKNENARLAVAVMTEWLSNADGDAGETVLSVIQDRGKGDDLRGALDIIAGFVTLSGTLLARRVKEAGISEEETLRDLALRFAGE